MLVTFHDPDDPKSVEMVDPDDLAMIFGKGVKLKAITVEITEDAVSVGIEKRLPSFGPETGFDDWRRKKAYGDPRAISLSDFKRDAE